MISSPEKVQKIRRYGNEIFNQRKCDQKEFSKRFTIPLNFEAFKHAVYSYRIQKDCIIRLELNSYEKVNLCSGDTAARYKRSNISLKNGTIFD